MRSHNKIIVLLVLTPFVFSFAFGLDIYVPIIPAMQMVFNTTQAMVQLTLSLFILTNGIGQLFFGPISDRFGRFKIIFISGVLFTLGAILSAIVRNIDLLILARIICALGTSGLFVVAFAIVRDIFSERDSGMMFSFLNAAISISPTFAPIIGGYLAAAYGWTSVFWFLMGLGVVTMLLSLFCIRETHLKEKRIPLNWQLFKRYWQLFSNRRYLGYVLLAGWGVGICFSFFSVSPLIIIRLLQVPMEHFGYYFALFGIAIAIGGM
ncbi:MAG: Bcr/CflA family efflux MFS transporter, partial [Gammaproteobacteria bacterium]|nr:Bcr/CflA family efflux MFS transporter [Gammaproteobacteria bacterium]